METQTRLSRHNKFISAENIDGIFSVSSDDSHTLSLDTNWIYLYIYIYIYIYSFFRYKDSTFLETSARILLFSFLSIFHFFF